MDREQEEMQFLGFFDIIKESFILIRSCRKIFASISLALIVPLAFVFLLHVDVSDVLMSKIITNEEALERSATPRSYDKLSNILSKEWTAFLLFKAVYFTFLLVLSLLSTSAVVYTVACVYTSREFTFRKVLSIVPRVWKRLMVTFMCAFYVMFMYNAFAFILIGMAIEFGGNNAFGALIVLVLGVLYLVGFVYLSIVWQLASVLSVLEDDKGVKAMIKSKDLIKGKVGLSVTTFFLLHFLLGFVQMLFEDGVVQGGSLGAVAKVGYGIICLVLLSGVFLFGLVIQTVIYFVCKSYHHENIDKSALSDHLEVYLGEYVPLTAKDIQLEEYRV